MTKRFEQAYNALYNAFMTDTLAKGTCAACAVGNIVAAAQGGTIDEDFYCTTENNFWARLFCSDITGQNKYFKDNPKDPLIRADSKRLKDMTGYTVQEMALVEEAFESNTEIDFSEYFVFRDNDDTKAIIEDQFKGLMAVMDVLIKLDEVEEGQTYKNNFKNKFATV